MAVEVGSAVGYLDLDISGFISALRTANEEAGATAQKMEKTLSEKFKSAGEKISKVGGTLTKTVSLPLTGLATAGMKVATDFEQAMAEVRAITKATGDNTSGDFAKLRNEAIELGASTAFSAGEVANAMTEMAKAGWDTEQIIAGMSGVLDAAAASGESLGSVSTIVADAITGFGLKAGDSSRVADLLTQAANAGTIGINDLGETFKYVAPIASSLDISIEDVTTAVTALSMAGIKGSQAGTTLRTVMTSMTGDIELAGEAFGEMTVSATNSDGTMREFGDVLADLRVAFAGMTEAERAANAEAIAGKTGMSGLLAILNLSQEEYDKIAVSMNNAKDVAQKTAEVMQDNLKSKFEQFTGALESLAIVLADNIIPGLTNFVEWITGVIEKFTEMDPATQKFVLGLAGILIAIGPVLTIIGKLTSGVGSIIGLVSKFGATAATAANPVTSAGVAIGGVAKAALGLIGAGAGILLAGAGLALMAQSSIALANAGWPAIAVMGGMVVAIVGLAAGAAAIGPALTAGAVGLVAFGGAVALIGVGVLAASAGITLLAGQLPTIAEYGAQAASGILELSGAMAAFGAGVIVAGAGILVLSTELVVLGAAFAVIGGAAIVAAAGVALLATAMKSTATSVKSIEKSANSSAKSLESMVKSVSVVEAGLNGLESIVGDAVNAIKNAFTNEAPSAVENGMSKMSSAVDSGMANVNSSIRSGFASAISYIRSVASQSYTWGADIIQGLANGIRSRMDTLRSAVNQAANIIYSNLHFSRPDEGPLRNYETWMPDFMEGLAKGIHDNSYLVKSAVQDVASDMKLDDVESAKTELFTNSDTEKLNTYNVTLVNTIGLYKQLIEQMRMCAQYSGIMSGDNNLLNSVITRVEERVSEKPADDNRNEESKKPDTLTIPISIGEEQIENVVVDLLRREVRV